MRKDCTLGHNDDNVEVELSEYHKVKTEDGGEEIKMSEPSCMNYEAVAKKEDPIQKPKKIYKRFMLSLTKPSHLLRYGPGSKILRWENRIRLRYLLRKLVRQHNWVDASGVLSVLLKGTSAEKCPVANRLKYTASMELLNHVESDDINPTRIKRIYDIWTKRVGSMKESPLVEKFVLSLESILLYLTQGDIEEANLAAMSCEVAAYDPLKQNRHFESHPMSNILTALTFYEKWCSKIPRKLQWKNSDQDYSPMQSDFSGKRFNHNGSNSEVHDTVYSHETETPFRDDSNTSVMIGKTVSMEINNNLCKEVTMEDQVNLKRENPTQNIKPQNFYMNSAENEAPFSNDDDPMSFASVVFALEGMDSWLLPIRLPKSKEDYENFKEKNLLGDNDYKKAMECLQLALYSTPPVSAALLPFIQLLLVGGRVDEALKVLDNFCSKSLTEIPIRLRASLLDCFDRDNYGDYSADSLLEMIGLHLDATFADHNTWRDFALCFLKISQYEEDRMSVCLNGNGEKKQGFTVRYNRIPKILTEGKQGKSWMFRCRWWLNRHFSKKVLASDIATGDLQLLTYKAACASHMYGQEFHYVVKAYTSLQDENDRDLFMFLRMHMQNSIRLSDHLSRNK
ncbi:TAF RNA polymerase I subunit A [Citrus sinensis]|uniref:TAF RNA polymerase I subunit A n=1 Tax=Citrus sinensis TaxID=2711 RepID=A0ACB8M073_CITSI|nr:TAF RNA polymerase I subunit A [Citrus sinensis]